MSSLRAARIAFGVFLVAAAVPAEAQQQPLRLSIQDGRATLHAQNVPVRAILAEWARIGGTRIVNGESIAGAPVSLDLNGVPEREVLAILLRNVSGYVLGARMSAAAGASAYDRILILPTSAAPRAAAAPAPVPGFNPPRARVQAPVPPEIDPNVNPPDYTAPNDVQEAQSPGPPQRFNIPGAPGMPPTFQQAQPFPDNGAPVPTAQPGNPFGVPSGSSSRPGVITPVPEPRATTPQRGIQPPD